jgi:hypothetical protein
MMVWLGGPSRGGFRPRLHDAPPGYRPSHPKVSLKEQQRIARRDWILEHILAVVLVLIAGALLVIILIMIATR